MDKFWNWIHNKGYGFEADTNAPNSLYTDTSFISDIPKQMLIGYMIEYLIENRLYIPRNIFEDFLDIDAIYIYLEEQINWYKK